MITQISANSTKTIALHGSATGESAGFIMGNNINQQYINYTSTVAGSIANLEESVVIAAGASGFVVKGVSSSDTQLYFISNTASITPVTTYLNSGSIIPVAGLEITSLDYLNNFYYAYTSGLILRSADGINWEQVEGVTPVTSFISVNEVSSSVYAALDVHNNIYLGATPTSIINQTAASSDAITAVGGTLYTATYSNTSHTALGLTFSPSATSLGPVTDQLTLDFGVHWQI